MANVELKPGVCDGVAQGCEGDDAHFYDTGLKPNASTGVVQPVAVYRSLVAGSRVIVPYKTTAGEMKHFIGVFQDAGHPRPHPMMRGELHYPYGELAVSDPLVIEAMDKALQERRGVIYHRVEDPIPLDPTHIMVGGPTC